MAVIKAVKAGASLSEALDYVEKKAELAGGKDCPDDRHNALEIMRATKELYEQQEGAQYYHYVQSFKEGEISAEKCHEIGQKYAEKVFPGHEVYIATHEGDNGCRHNHFIVNSVNFENGRKWHIGPPELEQMKELSDKLCKEQNLSVIDRKNERSRAGEVRIYDQAKYHAVKKHFEGKGTSDIVEAYQAVDQAKNKATSVLEFKQEMEKQGYKTKWDDTKHVTFTHPNGKKFRLSNISKTFSDDSFSKEGLKQDFERNVQLTKAPKLEVDKAFGTIQENINLQKERIEEQKRQQAIQRQQEIERKAKQEKQQSLNKSQSRGGMER